MTAEKRGVIRVQQVVKDFRPGFGLRRKRVLHGVTFEVREGEIFGFVGPNGAGKTTTLKILMGLIQATEGSASILGCDVGESEFRDQIGFLPENPYFYPFLTAREILDFYARLSGVGSRRRRARVDELLEVVNLAHAADSRLRTSSGSAARSLRGSTTPTPTRSCIEIFGMILKRIRTVLNRCGRI